MLLMMLGGYSLLLCSRYFVNNRLMISQLMDEKINRITKFDLAPKKPTYLKKIRDLSS